MKKFLFLMISFFIMTFFSEAADNSDNKSSLEVDTSNTLKKDSDKKPLNFDSSTTLNKDGQSSLKFDTTATFDRSSTKNTANATEKKIRELIKKDPKKVKTLLAKSTEMAKLSQEAKKYKDVRTAKNCSRIANSLKTLANFHNDKKVSDKNLYQAYNDCKSIEKDLKQIKLRLGSAKRNTPQARKIRSFQRSARDYLQKSQRAAQQGYKAKAEYYRTCAKLRQNAAKVYSKNPKIEDVCNARIKKARVKYNHDSMKELSVRFQKRAKKYREQGDEKRAAYYDKAAELKDKIADAYAKNNKDLVKSLQKEYEDLQKTKK